MSLYELWHHRAIYGVGSLRLYVEPAPIAPLGYSSDVTLTPASEGSVTLIDSIGAGVSGMYDIGDAIRLRSEFRDANGALANPTTVTGKIKKPDGSTASLTFSNLSTGVYTTIYTADQAGKFTWRCAGTGAIVQAGEKTFRVRKQVVT